MDTVNIGTKAAPKFPLGNEVKSRMAKESVLIIEDDPDISELLQYNLEREGYKVHCCTDGEIGLQQAVQINPQFILLDLMLPGMDGLSICRRLREHDVTLNTPVVMITAKGEESDVIVGLEIGADDYVTKPFSPRELIARMRAVLRRNRGAGSSDSKTVKQVGPLKIDSDRHEVFLNGAPLTLTLAEHKLLATLTSRPGRVFTREQLLEKITGGETYVIDRNVDVHVRAIRKKLGDDANFIITVRGVGYKCLE